MPLAHRIIPVLLHDRHILIKGRGFDWHRPIGHVQQAARIYATRGVDELILLDINATDRAMGPDVGLIESIAGPQFTPLTVGGGIRHQADVQALLDAGADKVAIRSAWRRDPTVVQKLADRYGSQAICVSIDYRLRTTTLAAVISAAQQAQDDGAGEILLTDMDREGACQGYDLQTIAAVTDRLEIPVIAHGGAGSYEHMAGAILAGASAVAAGTLFAFHDATPRQAAEYMAERGIEVRA